MTLPLITLGTAAFNEEQSIARAIESVRVAAERLGIINEFIVVTSGCTDQTEEAARYALRGLPRAQLINKPIRLSKCAALNLVAERARGAILVFFDADLILHPNALVKFLEAFVSNCSLALAFGRMIPLNGPSPFWTKLGKLTAAALHSIRSLPDESGLWLVCGPLYAVRVNDWTPLPEGLMADDLYIGLSAQSKGLGVAYLPDAVAYGLYPQNLRDYMSQKLRNRMARIQLRSFEGNTWREVPLWIGAFAIRRLRWSAIRHLPILVIDGILSAIALSLWVLGDRPNALWSIVPSTKLP